MTERNPMGAKSLTMWGAGFCLIGNGVLCALGMVIEPMILTELAQALAGDIGPSFQIGLGASALGIRRRL